MRWKVVEQKGGQIAVLGGHDARFRPTSEETLLWEGEAADNSDALFKAHEVRPDIDMVGLKLKARP